MHHQLRNALSDDASNIINHRLLRGAEVKLGLKNIRSALSRICFAGAPARNAFVASPAKHHAPIAFTLVANGGGASWVYRWFAHFHQFDRRCLIPVAASAGHGQTVASDVSCETTSQRGFPGSYDIRSVTLLRHCTVRRSAVRDA
jgi:hypothetical protein